MSDSDGLVTVPQLLAYLRENRQLWPVARIARTAKLSRSSVHAVIIKGTPPSLRVVDGIVRALGGRVLVEVHTGKNRVLGS